MPNRLITETSPYLRQHANNPVDWYPWSEEALERAVREDKPIILSVGYSACHWCHVMERESFENPEIAQMMNDHYVSIKVDREERPDIDSIYMSAVQAMTGHGGWPMTVFLTPDAKPFYGGTYFPPEDRGGMPSFPRILAAIAEAYVKDKDNVDRTTEALLERMEMMSTVGSPTNENLTASLFSLAFKGVGADFDEKYGGIGIQPKFPQPMTYEFLIRYYLRTGDTEALDMVETTLHAMARGGIYDQVGGGFHRYSTDTFWLVPHFEKMLYDNALLVRLYLHAFQVTRRPIYRRVVEQTLDYVLREMTSPEGGFYSAQDADSEGVEGKYFVWLQSEIENVLGEPTSDIVGEYYGVTSQGNFEGKNILHIASDPQILAKENSMTDDQLTSLISESNVELLNERDGRISPELDVKILTSWNALMMRAFAEAGAVLDRLDYVDVARQNADFILNTMINNGRLLRTYRSSDEKKSSGEAKLNAYLEDYAFLIDGLIGVHEVTFDQTYLEKAIEIGYSMVDLFWDENKDQFFDTGRDHETLVIRPRDFSDNAMPSGSSMAAEVLIKLSVITGDQHLRALSKILLHSMKDIMIQFPTGAGQWLCALDMYLDEPKEIVIVGERNEELVKALFAEIFKYFLPNRVFLGLSSDSLDVGIPLFEGRGDATKDATAYVCRNYVCNIPTNIPGELAKQLLE